VEIAGFAAVETIILAILHQPDLVLTLAQNAVALAIAEFFRSAALVTQEFFRHDKSDFSFSWRQRKVCNQPRPFD